MDANEMIQEFITAFPQVVGEHVRAQFGKPVQHTLTAREAAKLNSRPLAPTYQAGQVVSAIIAGISITTDASEYVTLRLDDGAELYLVPRPWTEELRRPPNWNPSALATPSGTRR
ncbi:hypothetical protein [Micromonospora sp. KLBMP9576]|uniref:hypothetical protein n=1 Tax=Micromonospora sp. KLBMP9576 TaxID=3424769 RepID=UPI003D8D7CE8